MKGYRFYEEYETNAKKRKREGTGNVLALDVDAHGRALAWDGQSRSAGLSATAAVFDYADSPVCGCSIAPRILLAHYRRIPEARAREIHPALFEVLDRDDTLPTESA